MRKTLSTIAALVVFGASGAAFAHGCPKDMKAIDDKLAAKPTLSADASAKVTKLRKDGEDAHKAG